MRRSYLLMLTWWVSVCCSMCPGCAKKEIAPAPVETIPQEIFYTIPKWKQAGMLSEKMNTVQKVLEGYLGSKRSATNVIKDNYWKYSKGFYNALSYGTGVYISEDGELLIVLKEETPPDEVSTIRLTNPEYHSTQHPSTPDTPLQQSEPSNAVTEEELAE